MPAAKTITQLYLEHEKRFSKQLKRAKSLEEEDLHKLRVEIKNLRVLFAFLQQLQTKNLKLTGLLEFLKPVFKKAGKIRTVQLNLKLSKAYRSASMSRFRDFLQKREKKARVRFVKELKAFDKETFKGLHKKKLNLLEKIEAGITARRSEAYVRRVFVKVRTALFNTNKDEALHEIRKHFKTLKNMGRLFAELKQVSPLHAEIKKTEALYEKIGQWHDELVFTESFETYVLQKEKPEAQKNAQAFVSKLKAKNEKIKLQLILKLHKELN